MPAARKLDRKSQDKEYLILKCASVAQLVLEHNFRKVGVVGANPA